MEEIHADVLVVGAGLTGLMAANLLQKQGIDVALFEQAHTVGGRLDTVSIGPGRADLGAQFFTARTPEFQNWVHQWEMEKIVYLWSMGWSHGSLETSHDGHPRYAVHGGMRALAEHLAHDLDRLFLNTRIATVTPTNNDWLVQDEDGDIYTCATLLLTAPVPQSLAPLQSGATRLSTDDLTILESIQYDRCLCGVFWIDGAVHLPEPGAVQMPDSPIIWIADNRHKGISREAALLTVHASPKTSHQLWSLPDNEALAELRAATRPYVDARAKIREAHLKRWNYSLPHHIHPEPYLMAENLPPLVFAGDAFGGPRVEGAALSGVAAARAILEDFRRR